MQHRKLHEANRQSWNFATRRHNAHKEDQARFLREGGSTLFPEELELLGDLQDCRLVHLLCNSGQDSLCLARAGAKVTGVDISDEAIAFARRLSAASGIAADFVRSDVYDWLREAPAGEFDAVFCSYGALCWLSDLRGFLEGAARLLRPGGMFVNVEFHPLAMMFEADGKLTYPYFSEDPYTWDDGVGNYVGLAEGALSPSGHVVIDEPYENPHPVHEFLWTIGDIVSAAAATAGMRIESLREYPYANGYDYNGLLVPGSSNRFQMPEGMPALPLMYGLVARKEG